MNGTGRARIALVAATFAVVACSKQKEGDARYPSPANAGESFAPALAVASVPGGHRIVGARLAPGAETASAQHQVKGGVTP
jgi:hypothetical protein